MMGIFTVETGEKIGHMAEVLIFTMMVRNTMETGMKTDSMEKDTRHGQMELPTKESMF